MIDTHAHLEEQFYTEEEIESAVRNAKEAGVKLIINSGTNAVSSKEVIKIAEKYPDIMRVTIGIHPNNIDESFEEEFRVIKNLANHPLVIGIGECGLDYYRSEKKEAQTHAFKCHLDLAVKHNLPVVVHSREAVDEVYEILKDYKLKGILHCFLGDEGDALKFIELGYLIGIGGIVTFKNSNLKEVIKEIDLRNIVLETDSPFLSPMPFRGQKNEPARVREIALFIAKIKNKSATEITKITSDNTTRLFDKIPEF